MCCDQIPCVCSAALLWIRFDAGMRTRPAEAGISSVCVVLCTGECYRPRDRHHNLDEAPLCRGGPRVLRLPGSTGALPPVPGAAAGCR